jgi:hypothetical protein
MRKPRVKKAKGPDIFDQVIENMRRATAEAEACITQQAKREGARLKQRVEEKRNASFGGKDKR